MGAVPYSRIIAARRYHPIWSDGFGCTYAIVRLSADAPSTPPPAPKPRAPVLSYGGDWQPGPDPGIVDLPGDSTWKLCEIALDARWWQMIEPAAMDPDGWTAWDGNRLFVYSAKARIAARLRVGD